MKTWLRIVVSLIVIFFGIGLLLVFKNLQILTATTGQFILITGTNTLIIGGILLLSLTILTYRKGVSSTGRQMALEESGKEAGIKALAQLLKEPYDTKTAFALEHYLKQLAHSKDKEDYRILKESGGAKNLMSLASEVRRRAESRGDPYLGKFISDIIDGRSDDDKLRERGWYNFKGIQNKALSSLASAIYRLFFQAYSHRQA